VAGADSDCDGCRLVAELAGDSGDLLERLLEVGVDVDGERLQRTEVDDLRDSFDRLTRAVCLIESVYRGQEPREGLARAGRRPHQRVVARDDRRPPSRLRVGGPLGEPAFEPGPHGGMELLWHAR